MVCIGTSSFQRMATFGWHKIPRLRSHCSPKSPRLPHCCLGIYDTARTVFYTRLSRPTTSARLTRSLAASTNGTSQSVKGGQRLKGRKWRKCQLFQVLKLNWRMRCVCSGQLLLIEANSNQFFYRYEDGVLAPWVRLGSSVFYE